MRRTGRTALAAALLALGLAAPTAAATAEYRAAVDRDRIALDETVTLTVTLAFEGDEPDSLELPGAPEFEVLRQGRSDQMSFSFGTGGSAMRKVRTFTLVLRPLREGALAIGPGVAVVDGRRVETGRLTVRVGPAGLGTAPRAARPTSPPPFPTMPGFPDPFGELRGRPVGDGDLFVTADLDRAEAFLGEGVTLSIHLWSRVEISGIEALKLPRLDGFWAEDVESPKPIVADLRYVEGVPYRVYLVRRRALFPLAAGEARIEPVEVDVQTGFGLFGGGVVHRKSEPLTLTVKPLPPGAPPGFASGNVGDFALAVEAEPAEVTVGTPVTVRIRASGTGNLQGLELPALPRLDGCKVFDPTRRDEPRPHDGRWGGDKVLEYVLVPDRPGTIEVPALALPLFDPAEAAYRTVTTAPLSIVVRPGSGGVVPAPAPGADGPGIAAIRPAPAIAAPRSPLWERPWFLPLLLVPPLVLLGAAVAPRLAGLRARGAPARTARRAGAVARRRLAAAASLGARRDPAVHAELDRALHAYLAAKLGRPTAGLSRDALAATLAEAGAPEAGPRLAALLDACDAGRFAPGAVDGAAVDRLLDEAHALLDDLEAGRLGEARR